MGVLKAIENTAFGALCAMAVGYPLALAATFYDIEFNTETAQEKVTGIRPDTERNADIVTTESGHVYQYFKYAAEPSPLKDIPRAGSDKTYEVTYGGAWGEKLFGVPRVIHDIKPATPKP